MATTRKPAGRRTAAKKGTGITGPKVKRVARKAKASIDAAAHDAGLAAARIVRKLKRTAQNLETKVREAKGPARRRARQVELKLLSALQSAGESISAAARKAKAQLAGSQKQSVERKTRRRKRVA